MSFKREMFFNELFWPLLEFIMSLGIYSVNFKSRVSARMVLSEIYKFSHVSDLSKSRWQVYKICAIIRLSPPHFLISLFISKKWQCNAFFYAIMAVISSPSNDRFFKETKIVSLSIIDWKLRANSFTWLMNLCWLKTIHSTQVENQAKCHISLSMLLY